MTINSFTRNVVISATLIVTMIIALAIQLKIIAHVAASDEQRYVSYLLADELRQSSDDLTRLARTYVMTRDAEYERQYLKILAIRNGEAARPKDYQRIYWDFVAVDGKAPREDSADRIGLIELMRRNGFTDAELAKLEEAKRASDALVKTETEAMTLVKQENAADAYERAAKMMHDKAYHQNKAIIMKPVDEFYVLMGNRLDAERATANGRKIIIQIVTGLILIALGFFLWRTYRSLVHIIGGTVGDMTHSLSKMAAGDFSSQIEAKSPQSLLGQLNEVQRKLGALLHRIRDTSATINSQAVAISESANSAKQLVGNQMDSTTSMVTAIENLVNSVNNASKNSDSTRAMATASETTLEEGNHIIRSTVSSIESIAGTVRETSASIGELNEHAQQINTVVRVISEIADQTNLLALNAAIEAARAGETGRGFAVVADEVRKLAERTAQSTREITGTIQKIQGGTAEAVARMSDGVESVDEGVNMANKAGGALDEIRQRTGTILQSVNNMTAMLREQANAANSVAVSVTLVSDLAAKSNEKVAQVSSAADQLLQAALALDGNVVQFKF